MCLNDSNIKVTLTMRLNLLPHEAIPSIFWEPGWCNGRCFTANDYGELW